MKTSTIIRMLVLFGVVFFGVQLDLAEWLRRKYQFSFWDDFK